MTEHRADLDHAEVAGSRVVLATVGGRFLARLVDLVVVAVPTVLAMLLFGPDGLLALLAAVSVVGIAYEAVLVSLRGNTPGRSLLNIALVDVRSGAAPGWGTSLARSVLAWLPPWWLLGWLNLFDDPRRRGWYDRIAGTLSVRAT